MLLLLRVMIYQVAGYFTIARLLFSLLFICHPSSSLPFSPLSFAVGMRVIVHANHGCTGKKGGLSLTEINGTLYISIKHP